MYLEFFSFTQRPFDNTPDTRFLYPSPQHQEAIETLLYGIRERRGFMIFTGEVGTGKTTTIRALLNQLGDTVETSLIVNPLLSTVELIKSINHDFGCDISQSADTVQGQLLVLNQFLLNLAESGRNAVVIIDESQNLTLESLEMVRLLSNLETETHKLLQIIMVGQPELRQKLDTDALRPLRQRIQLHYSLRPMTLRETEEYILFRINKVSTSCTLVFESPAVKKIYECSGGIPRMISSMCDLTLLSAYADESHLIKAKHVDEAYREVWDKSWSLDKAKPARKSFTLWGRKEGGVDRVTPS